MLIPVSATTTSSAPLLTTGQRPVLTVTAWPQRSNDQGDKSPCKSFGNDPPHRNGARLGHLMQAINQPANRS